MEKWWHQALCYMLLHNSLLFATELVVAIHGHHVIITCVQKAAISTVHHSYLSTVQRLRSSQLLFR